MSFELPVPDLPFGGPAQTGAKANCKLVSMKVKSPNEREWEQIKRELIAALKSARKSGDDDQIKKAREDYDLHLALKDKYVEAGRRQLTIFDL